MWVAAKWSKPGVLFLCGLAFAGLARPTRANVTILLEEPYSYDGALAGTGHAAVYLDRICAETPITLRRCGPGEHGAVVSRYTRIAGYDWFAIPLVPYLYAVENPEDIPLYADPKLVAFLRDQYRRAHLEEFAPDGPSGETPKGDWYELVGSSYDRTNYGFEIETTPEQDDAFIAWMNSSPNRANYQFVSRNCADFVRQALDFYYPRSVSRGNIADLFVSTPKHVARSLVRYGKHHPDLEFTNFVIPQVPGSVRRSKPVRGVLESVFRAKKYVVVLAAFHPFIAGGVASVYLVGDRFNPAKNARVFSLTGDPAAPPTAQELRAYRSHLRKLGGVGAESDATAKGIPWQKFIEKSQPEFDAEGRLDLRASDGNGILEVGVRRRDLLDGDGPVELQRGLMVSRLKQTVSNSRAPRISGAELREDWKLLERIQGAEQESAARKQGQRSLSVGQRTERTSD